MSYKIGYEPWGPSPLDNIAPPKPVRMRDGLWPWFGLGVLIVVVFELILLAIGAVVL